MPETIQIYVNDGDILIIEINQPNAIHYKPILQAKLQGFAHFLLEYSEISSECINGFLTDLANYLTKECEFVARIQQKRIEGCVNHIEMKENKELKNQNNRSELNNLRLSEGPIADIYTLSVSHSLNAFKIILSRFKNFKNVACEAAFSNDVANDLVKIHGFTETTGDPHNEGQRVLILNLSDGKNEGKVVYKPTTVLMDYLLMGKRECASQYAIAESYQVKNEDILPCLGALFNTIIKKNTKAIAFFHPYKIFPLCDENGEFGFIEFIPKNDIPDNAKPTQAHWQGAGIVAVFAVFFGLTDVHKDNILNCYNHWYLIDMENALVPIPFSADLTVLFSPLIGGLAPWIALEKKRI